METIETSLHVLPPAPGVFDPLPLNDGRREDQRAFASAREPRRRRPLRRRGGQCARGGHSGAVRVAGQGVRLGHRPRDAADRPRPSSRLGGAGEGGRDGRNGALRSAAAHRRAAAGTCARGGRRRAHQGERPLGGVVRDAGRDRADVRRSHGPVARSGPVTRLFRVPRRCADADRLELAGVHPELGHGVARRRGDAARAPRQRRVHPRSSRAGSRTRRILVACARMPPEVGVPRAFRENAKPAA